MRRCAVKQFSSKCFNRKLLTKKDTGDARHQLIEGSSGHGDPKGARTPDS